MTCSDLCLYLFPCAWKCMLTSCPEVSTPHIYILVLDISVGTNSTCDLRPLPITSFDTICKFDVFFHSQDSWPCSFSTFLTISFAKKIMRRNFNTVTQHAVLTLNDRFMTLSHIFQTQGKLSDSRMFSVIMLSQFVFLFAADCTAASSTASLSICSFFSLSVSLLWQTRRVRRNEENLAGYLIQMCQLRGKCKRSSWLYLSHTAQLFKYRYQLAALNSSCQQLSIYLFSMPSVCVSVTLRPPELNGRQSAGRHWLYRLHCLQILSPPWDCSGVSSSKCFCFKGWFL